MQKSENKKLNIKFVRDHAHRSGYYVIQDSRGNMVVHLHPSNDNEYVVHTHLSAESTYEWCFDVLTSFDKAIERVAEMLDINKEDILAQYAIQGD